MDQKQKELYSFSDSIDFMTQAKQGSQLCMSYMVTTHRNSPYSNEYVTMPLGVISVKWKPVRLTLPSEQSSELTSPDEFDMAHGPLMLPDIAPMIFYGPQCQVLNAPFTAKLLKGPSPKVGVPFRMKYEIKNKTAKSQTLTFWLSNIQQSSVDESTSAIPEQLLIDGKVKGELQISPFEAKSLQFTFMSMVAGKVRCPCLQVSSGRHQSWVINESAVKERHFFVMP
jgi:hypothetical protein